MLPTDDDLSAHYIVYVETDTATTFAPNGNAVAYPNNYYLTLTYDNTEIQKDLPGWMLAANSGLYSRRGQFYPFRMDLDKSYLTVTDNTGLAGGEAGILWFWYLPFDIIPCENQ
jgi:hypothetical protein